MIIQSDSKHITSETESVLARIFLLYGQSTFNTVRLSANEFIQVINEANGFIVNRHHDHNKLIEFQVQGYLIDFVLDVNQ